MTDVLFVSDDMPTAAGLGGSADCVFVPGVPAPEDIADAEIVLVFGALGDATRANQVVGVLSFVAEQEPITVVVAYPRTFGQELSIVRAFAPCLPSEAPEQRVTANHAAFYEYMTIFGRSATHFVELPEDADVLGRLEEDVDHSPAAWCLSIGAGGMLYVIPYFVAGAVGLGDALLKAVTEHVSGTTDRLPGFLGDMRLEPEVELLGRVDEAKATLTALQQEAARLARFRSLVGLLSGNAFEQLVIDALNEVLEGTGHQADDREDLRVEDFWIVSNGGERALAEAKGIGEHVRRPDVNQVDNHRAEQGRNVEDLPGLLIVNIFRGDASMDRRRLPVNDDVIRHAVRQNVLVLRGIDLYRLLSRKLGGEPVGQRLVEALSAGGGWLMVEDDQIELRRE